MSTQPNPKAKGRAEAQDGPFFIRTKLPEITYSKESSDVLERYLELEAALAKEAKMSNTNDIFDTFIKAKEALDKLPAAEAKISELQASESILTDAVHNREAKIAEHTNTIADLEAKLTEAKKQIDEISFCELQARDNLETVLSALRLAANTAKSAEEFLNPLPIAPTTLAESPITQDGSEANSPAQSGEGSQGSGSDAPLASSGAESQSEANPIPADTTTGGTPTMDAGAISELGQSETPFASLTEGQSAAAMPSDATTPIGQTNMESQGSQLGGSNAPSPADASQRRPYWEKPVWMNWRTWQSEGGEVPQWARDRMFATN